MSHRKEPTLNPAPKQPDQSTYSGRFAARLRELREKTGMNGEQATEAVCQAGFTVLKRTYYNWESGVSTPTLDAFPALASALKLKRIRDLLPTE